MDQSVEQNKKDEQFMKNFAKGAGVVLGTLFLVILFNLLTVDFL
ncbi:MAG: hypothetical protein OEX00_09405 [Gammaproteobacteria bacterium]|nr:hypothetical protein [Gammaproteobacteria bacterium]MDH5692367.1 hypothetical protein [Gammaproteobacteria bacterium]